MGFTPPPTSKRTPKKPTQIRVKKLILCRSFSDWLTPNNRKLKKHDEGRDLFETTTMKNVDFF